ncbi:MAG: hypothetical protein Q7S06_00835 [Nanoarchaeota archaeon]|nr:hypothetical protein [Nanoarchaeota archaeon]
MDRKIDSIKTTQLSMGVISLIGSIFFIVLMLIISPIAEQYILLWIGIPVFLILILEGSIYWTSESIKIDEEKLKMKNENIFSQVSHSLALYYRYSSLIKVIFIFLIMIFVFGFVGYSIIKSMNIESLFSSTIFYVQLGIYGAYFLIMRPLIKKLFGKSKNPLKKFNKQNIPDYSPDSNGITLNIYYYKNKVTTMLVIIGLIAGISAFVLASIGQKQAALIAGGVFILTFILIFIFKGKTTAHPIKIGFNEINDIREFSYVEARSLLQYEIGPDINLQMQSTRDTIKFLRGEIDRPLTYIFPPVSAAKTLMIKGPEIFYLTPVSNEDNSDLIKAFRKFKSRK